MQIPSFLSKEHLKGDVRSAAVGAVMGTVANAIISWLLADAVSFTAFPSADGYTQPLVELVDAAVAEDSSLKVTFKPRELKFLYVCEYAKLSGKTSKDVLISYVSQYQMCLSIRRSDENSFVIEPRRGASDIEFRDNAWQCKCQGM